MLREPPGGSQWVSIRLALLVLVSLAIMNVALAEDESMGPVFVKEPPNRVDFSNVTGAEVECQAQGNPQPDIIWVQADGTAVRDVPGLRLVLPNGNLVFPPFRAEDYRQEVHAQIYSCLATSPAGSVHSRDVNVRAVVHQYYQSEVNNEYVIRGNSAILKCSIPSFVAEFVQVIGWEDNQGNSFNPDERNDGKYLVLPSGDLHIRDVGPEERYKTYQCRTKHRLTGETRLSATTGRLVITEGTGEIAPHSTGKKFGWEVLIASRGRNVALTHSLQAHPIPITRWYKFINGTSRRQPVQLNERVRQVSGILIIREARVEDSGKYLCIVNNSVGSESMETGLTVTAPLAAQIEPRTQTVDFGRPATFTCNVRGNPIKTISWLKDGKPLGLEDPVLRIESVKKEDKGMYQCFVRNDQESAQATAELKLGGQFEPPQIKQAFAEETLQPGPSVFLNCIASGNPTPEITWELDGKRLSSTERLQVGQYVKVNGDVVSHLNVSSIHTNDGGLYKCIAASKVGAAEHSARLNVYGSPFIRHMDKKAIVAGETLRVTCPVAGYPIESIVWERDTRVLPINRKQKVFPNGTLIIENFERHSDQATYTCVARNAQGYSARGILEIQVMVPPRWILEPADKAFAQGSDARVECKADGFPKPQVTWKRAAGDTPGDYTDLKLNNPDINVEDGTLSIYNIQKTNEGYYLCEAVNGIGSGLSAVILISLQAPPHFEIKLRNQTARRGDPAALQCEVQGEKPIGILWNMNNKRLDPTSDSRYTIRKEILANRVLAYLNIKRTERSDSALFTCVATNAFGSDDTSINLIVQEVPEIPYGLKSELGLFVELSWVAPYDGNSPIKHYVIEYKISKDSWESDIDRVLVPGSLQNIAGVFNLRPATTYHFRIAAENEIGTSDPSDTLTIITAEEAPSSPPSSVRVDALDQHTLKVTWKPPPREDWNGEILGYYVEYRLSSSQRPYTFETVKFSKEDGKEHHLQIMNLKTYRQYSVVVQAFNTAGSGPMSEEKKQYTAEGVPEQPPHDTTCTTLTSQTIHVSWVSPPLQAANGVITGYKVIYGPSESWYDENSKDTKITAFSETILHGLKKYTNYSMQVLAFTTGGDGVKSAAIHCQTEPDAPEAPISVKALVMSAESILISWRPPSQPNGFISQYTVYTKPAEKNVEAISAKVPPNQLTYEVQGLDKELTYDFWVTASTNIGEGQTSKIVTSAPNIRVPAKIASFDDKFTATYKEDVKLPCLAVGVPAPEVTWKIRDAIIQPSDRLRQLPEGSLFIKEVDRADAGEYSCYVENSFGHDTVTHQLIVHANLVLNEPKIIEDTLRRVTRGQILYINCTTVIDANVKYILNWRTPTKQSDRITTRLYEEAISANEQKITCELTINGVIYEDEGDYECTIATYREKRTSTIFIPVYEPGEKYIRLVLPRHNIYQKEYGEYTLWIVEIDAHPPPKLKWLDTKGNEITGTWTESRSAKYAVGITSSLTILRINRLTFDDSGLYSLQATHEVRTVTANFNLTVIASPIANFEGLKTFYLPKQKVEFLCNIVVYPGLIVSWTFLKEPSYPSVEGSEVVKLENHSRVPNIRGFRSMTTMTIEMSGHLICTACSIFGCYSATDVILVSDVPDGFDIIETDKQLTEGDDVEITCAASRYDYITAVWINNMDEVIVETDRIWITDSSTNLTHRSTLRITNVRKSDTNSHYVCAATDTSYSVIKRSEYKLLIHDPIAPFISETNMNKTAITVDLRTDGPKSIILKCHVGGIPKPNVTWYKDNRRISANEQFQFRYDNQELDIKYFLEESSGTYKCKVDNRLGKDENYQIISIKEKEVSKVLVISIAVLVLICIIFSIYFCIKLHREKVMRKQLMEAGLTHFEEGAVQCLNPNLTVDDQTELLPYDKRWEFPRERLKLGRELGFGAFGVVMMAHALGICKDEAVSIVAVKMVRKSTACTYIRALASELKIMVHLGKHLNVVNLLGACTKNIIKRELLVIVEYCRFGNMHDHLLRHRADFINQIDAETRKLDPSIGLDALTSKSVERNSLIANSSNSNRDSELVCYTVGTDSQGIGISQNECVHNNNSTQAGWRSVCKGDDKNQNLKPICTQDLLSWAFQVARGMEYLKQRKVLHGDLAARNILLAENNIVKISDFGLARTMYKDDDYKKQGGVPLPIKWMAIESIRDRIFSTQSDVWSFGIVLWEFFTLANTPYPTMGPERQYQRLIEGYRMEQPEYATDEVYNIMLQCWKEKPLSRPTFTYLVSSIGDLLEECVKDYYVDLNTPYMDMNTTVFENGKNDYLTMMSPPDYDTLVSPNNDYVNLPSVTPAIPHDNSYKLMSSSKHGRDLGICSPRITSNCDKNNFPTSNGKSDDLLDSESEPVELSPMLNHEDDNYQETDKRTSAPTETSH